VWIDHEIYQWLQDSWPPATATLGTVGEVASSGLQVREAGEESLRRIDRFVEGLGGELGGLALHLMARHGYAIDADGGGPHLNVLGHPLFELPLWLAGATGGMDEDVLLDICESSLCGYLSVRAEDDYFDGHWDEAKAAMMLSTAFRARHQALLAVHVRDPRFWSRFEGLWQAYGEAMLQEQALHDPGRSYGPDEFATVLHRSQPLEIPGDAVLSITENWDRTHRLSEVVRHLTKATQLFDDLIDAPGDLEDGNYTWVVRRLGGLDGQQALRRGMIDQCNEIVAEAKRELDLALQAAAGLVTAEIDGWAEERKQIMDRASQRMYHALFEGVASQQ
jgi:hypothetical protein